MHFEFLSKDNKVIDKIEVFKFFDVQRDQLETDMKQLTLSNLPSPSEKKLGWPWTEESPVSYHTSTSMNSLPTISIVTPSYNQGNFIEETIRSVLLQCYPKLEYIIIDGGSTDNTLEIIRKYEPWISYWVSEPDRGQSHALNKGFSKATGEILAWINSDDTYEPGTLVKVGDFFSSYSYVDVLYGNAKIIDKNSFQIGKVCSIPFNRTAHLYRTVPIPAQSAVFWRRKIFFDNNMLNEKLHYVMDADLLIRFCESGANFHFLHTVFGSYRCHESSKTFGASDSKDETLLSIPQLSNIKNKPFYKLFYIFFRLRQVFYLIIQRDWRYLFSRLLGRF